MQTNVESGGHRRLWIVLGVVAVLVAFGAARALTDDDVAVMAIAPIPSPSST